MMHQKTGFVRKHRKLIFTIAFIPAMAALGFLLTATDALGRFEQQLTDFRFSHFNRDLEASRDVVFVTVDEDSLKHLSPDIGGWPWGRSTVMSSLILEYIELGEPSIILFDILHTEYSPRAPGSRISDEDLGLVETAIIHPSISFAANLNGVVLGPGASSIGADRKLPDITDISFRLPMDPSGGTVPVPSAADLVLPFPELAENASMIHLVNSEPDTDGTTRHYFPVYRYGDGYYPSLSMKTVAVKLGLEEVSADGRDLVLRSGDGGSRRIPLEKNGAMRLNYYADFDRSFVTIPAESVIASAQNYRDGQEPLIPFTDFRDKIVVIGASAIGLKDIKVTPLGREVAGPYIHLTAISNILEGHFLTTVPDLGNELIIILTVALIVLATLYLGNPILRNMAGFTIVVLLALASLFVFKYAGIVVDMTDVLFTCLLAFFGALIFLSLTEGAEKSRISAAMGKYLAPTVMEEVLQNYDRLVGEVGRRKEITVLFSDIRGFTTLSEGFQAEEVVSILNTYLASMIDEVFRQNGTLDKMIGDAIMAFWGAPKDEPFKERLAVRTALAMLEKLDQVNVGFEAQGKPQLRIGVGVNTGDMIVGNIGSEKRLDYTLIGDNVNLGSRLEGLTKYYRVPIIISESTWEKVRDDFVCTYIGKVAVKGKHLGVPIYYPMLERNPGNGPKCVRAEAERAGFDEAHAFFNSGDFSRARAGFELLGRESTFLDGICSEMIERCDHFIADPPGRSWDGVWKMLDK